MPLLPSKLRRMLTSRGLGLNLHVHSKPKHRSHLSCEAWRLVLLHKVDNAGGLDIPSAMKGSRTGIPYRKRRCAPRMWVFAKTYFLYLFEINRLATAHVTACSASSHCWPGVGIPGLLRLSAEPLRPTRTVGLRMTAMQ